MTPRHAGQAAARHRERQGPSARSSTRNTHSRWRVRPLSELSPEDREQIKENLVRVELIAQEAEKSGLVNDPDVVDAPRPLAGSRCSQQASAQKYMKEHTADGGGDARRVRSADRFRRRWSNSRRATSS